MKKQLLYFLLSLFVFLFVMFLNISKTETFESFSLKFNDIIDFRLTKKEISKDVVFVAVDEPSVNRFGRWPWDREILAKGISKLNQADVVMMDMIFSEPTSEQKDEALSEALSSLNASVCGFFLRKTATQDVTEEEIDILSDSTLDMLQSQIKNNKPTFIKADFAEVNIPVVMSGCTLNGTFTTRPSKDHLYREYPVAVYFKDMLFPSLALQALRIKLNKDIEKVSDNSVKLGNREIFLNDEGFVRLNFYNKEDYRIVSFLDLYDGKIKPEFFKNKFVILGITEVGAGDIAPTPIGNIPGPLLHYTFLSNFLNNQLIKENKTVSYIFVFVFAFLPFLATLVLNSVVRRVLLNLIVYIVSYIAVLYIFQTTYIYIDMFYPLLSLILSMIAIEVSAFNIQQKDEKFLKDAFGAYLSKDLLNELIHNPNSLKLGGEKKELSILFSDIRSFTTLSESMSPEELIKLLNRYFTPMTNAVLENKGMLDKYIGDAIMAFWNAPVDVANHADAACKSALLMIERLNILNKELTKEKIPNIHIGIGINTDEVVVGNMGSDTRFNYTIIGDGVNLASRVEGLTKQYGVEILITEFTVKRLKDDFLYRKVELVKVKGKEKAVLMYQLLENSQKNKEIVEIYNEALKFYIDDDIINAKKLFKKLVDEYDDPVSKYHLNNISNGHKWGVHKMTTK